jgi:hypothetical protein
MEVVVVVVVVIMMMIMLQIIIVMMMHLHVEWECSDDADGIDSHAPQNRNLRALHRVLFNHESKGDVKLYVAGGKG